MKKHKTQLFKKHNLFDTSTSDDQRMLYRFEIKSIIDELDDPDAQDNHILGLVYYDTAKDAIDIKEAHEYFIQSLEKDKNYYMARLYSAHCYHDYNELEMALEEYLKVDKEKLKEEFSIWLYIKLQEQIGYCYHKLNNLNKANEFFNNVLELYRKYDYDDLVDPKEIYECLNEANPTFIELKNIERNYYKR